MWDSIYLCIPQTKQTKKKGDLRFMPLIKRNLSLLFSSALQQCGVCEDGPVPPPVGIDTIKTCHIYLRQVDAEDPWGDDTSGAVKTFKIVDIRDINIPHKSSTPAQVSDPF